MSSIDEPPAAGAPAPVFAPDVVDRVSRILASAIVRQREAVAGEKAEQRAVAS